MKTLPPRKRRPLVNFIQSKVAKADGEYMSNAHALVMETDGKIKFHLRNSAPCYGPLRPYDEKKDGYKMPSDLTHLLFPDGTPVGLALPLNQGNEFIRWALTSEMSPWRNLVGKVEIIDSPAAPLGMIVNDTHVNSDVLINFLFFTRQKYKRLRPAGEYSDASTLAELMLMSCLHPWYDGSTPQRYSVTLGSPQWRHGNFSLKRIATGTPDVLENFDFFDRAAYRRPVIENIWGGPERTIDRRELHKMLGLKAPANNYEPSTIVTLEQWAEKIPLMEKEIVSCQSP